MLRHSDRSLFLTLVVLAFAALIGGCGPAETPAAAPTTIAPPPADTPVPPTDTPAPTATSEPTDTPVPPTDTPEPTDTPVPPTDTPASTDTPAPPTNTPAPLPDASVKAETVNLRAAPGTAAARLGGLKQGDALAVLGQTGNCAWLKVKTAAGKEGWVARVTGSTELVTLNLACGELAVIEAPTAIPQPTAGPQPTIPPTAAPEAVPPILDPNLGCYLIENFIGTELTFTFTAKDWNWNDSTRIPSMGNELYCLGPGRYSYTIDGQPPWGGTGGEMEVKAGYRLRWTISGRQ